MKILTIKDTSLEKVSLKDPEYVESVMYVDIRNEKSPLYLQTPKMFSEFNQIDDTKLMKLLFDNKKSPESLNKFYKLLKDIEDHICHLISENCQKWFNTENSYENIKNNFFKSSLRLPEELHDPLSLNVDLPYEYDQPTFEIYNQKQTKISINKIKKEYEVITLLLANELVITENSAHIVWEVAQIKVFQKKKRIVGCGIREEKEEPVEMSFPSMLGTVSKVEEKEEVFTKPVQQEQAEEKTLEKTEIVENSEEQVEEQIQEPEEKVEPETPVVKKKRSSRKKKEEPKKIETKITLVDDENDGDIDEISEYDLEE